MSAESSLATALQASGVTALVSTRVYADMVPSKSALPAIAYARQETEFVTTVHGTAPLGSTATLEITCIARTRSGADAVADAVVAAVGAAGFYVVGREGLHDIETELWAAILNVSFNE